jgi:hypothetical protein
VDPPRAPLCHQAEDQWKPWESEIWKMSPIRGDGALHSPWIFMLVSCAGEE